MANILVIDDDKSILELLQFMLRKDGHKVSIAPDGKAGVVLALKEKPDLILLDVMMPEMDGFTVTGTLFKEKSMRAIPIIILTAKGNTRDILELVPNVRAYLDKPFDPDHLMKKIKEVLPPQFRAA